MRRIRNRLIAAGVAIALMVFGMILMQFQSASEWWMRTFVRAWVAVFGSIAGVLPFSVFEVGAFLLALGACVAIVCCIRDCMYRQYTQALAVLALAVSIGCTIGAVYTLTASTGYHRDPVAIPMCEQSDMQAEYFDEAYIAFRDEWFALDAELTKDASGAVVCPYSFRELSDKIRREFSRLDLGYFGNFSPMAKPVLHSFWMSQFHIVGITFVPTGEPNVNYMAPSADRVVTIAHEMAHTHGVMREYEANLVAYYLLASSSDPYLRYMGMREISYVWSELFFYSNRMDEYREIYAKPSGAEALDRQSSEFWSQYHLMDDIGEFFNDLYLKLIGGQSSGTGSYWDGSEGTQIGEDENGQPIFENPIYSQTARMVYSLYAHNA